MKRQIIDGKYYKKLIEAYRKEPANVSHAARVTGTDRRTCSRGWTDGWPRLGFKPIKELVESEQAETRSRLKKVREDELTRLKTQETQKVSAVDDGAREDAIMSRVEEARTVRAARHNAMGLLVVVQGMLKGATRLAASMESEIANADLKPATAIALFQGIASTARQANETARLAITMERTLLGEPEKVIGVQITMTDSEALREIDMANRAAVRAREAGILDVTSVSEAVPAE